MLLKQTVAITFTILNSQLSITISWSMTILHVTVTLFHISLYIIKKKTH